ncbi:PREDICTED: uncharacterized protein LOC109584426 [Amphimedon queenslandica]|uniref:Fibronectin type-III domain-containing protein n=1 Tax=Amphimedon queenslandica TaxID=400682 RepID=A0A1X7U726_AMPQE|nr:PREDICTED: uncharacterized protein LOC109584426 [Amphimedon queenslandica]|eukprot:XP_019855731.1 PREDICTED: uncharacterized protein LOC109584426 [Amphimedon queenslandica]
MRTSPQVVIFYFALLWLKVTSYEFDCNKLVDVCPGETVQVYCRDNEGSNTIMWRVRSSLANKPCRAYFGVQDSYGTVKGLEGKGERNCHELGGAKLLSKVPNSTNLTLNLALDLISVTCRSTAQNSPSKVVCPITFKGKPSPPENVSYVRQGDDQVLVLWSSTNKSNSYKMIVTSSQANESYNRTLYKNSALLTIKKDVDYTITVTALNCAGELESLPSEPIMILSPPDVNVTIKDDNLTITWNQSQDECFIMKIEDEQNLECSKKGSLSRKLTSHKLYEIELLSKANGSLVTGSLWKKQYCVAYSVSPPPLVYALVSNDILQVNVTVGSYCDPGELLQDCLCPVPSEIILQLNGENKTHHDPTETTINIDLSDISSESAIVFGTVWVKNNCGVSKGVHFFEHLPISPKTDDDTPTDGIGCIVPSLVLLPSLLILLALLFV